MRVRLIFEDPLPPYKCWYEIPNSCTTVHDLQKAIRKGFRLDEYCKTTRLDLDGFFLLPASTIAGSIKEGDLLQVMIRRKSDNLPPRSLPVAGRKKRSSAGADLEHCNLKRQKTTNTNNTSNARPAGKGQKQTQAKPELPSVNVNNATKSNNNARNRNKKKKNNSNSNTANTNNANQSTANKQPGPTTKSNNQKQTNNQKQLSKSVTSNRNKQSANTAKEEVNLTPKRQNVAKMDAKKRNEKLPVAKKQDHESSSASSTSDSSSSDSSSSDSSSSDSSSSDSSSSDSTSESSDDSSNDSSDDSSSNSSDDDSPDLSELPKMVAPGQGIGATKLRNKRRANEKARLFAQNSSAVHQGQDSTNGQVMEVDSRSASLKSPQAPCKAKANVKASNRSAPKVTFSIIELDDKAETYLGRKGTPKKAATTTQDTSSSVISTSEATAIVVPTKDETGDQELVPLDIDTLPRDYEALPKQEGQLNVDDVIAYKTLEMGPSYTPIISDFKEAKVLKFSAADMTAEVQLARKFRTVVELDSDGQPILGKFDVYDEEEIERARQTLVDAAIRSHSRSNSKSKSASVDYDDYSKSSKRKRSTFSNLKATFTAWGIFIGFLVLILVIVYQIHYKLPAPVYEGTDPVSGKLQFSEENVRQVVRHMTRDIGYRVVGTDQELETKNYLIRELSNLKEKARLERLRGLHDLPHFDMWIQVGDGSHRFDFMSKVVMKMYTNMTNIIVRLSCGPECDQNSILLNAHYDTTLGSPGAADDALGCGVMMEIIRIMSLRPAPKKNSVVFLFNGGEESLQDASHSFITGHELKDNIRAVVNLEACGTSGPEILFQANSREMIDAYRTVPYPHGTVLANDLFATGLILSDTDFRQFVDHGNLTGLDMAVYKNSYLYHTHLDLDEFMEEGLPQHMGENALALATYLTEEANLVNLERTSSVVFFDIFGLLFVSYSWTTAIRSHILIGGLSLFTVATQASRPTVRSILSILLSFVVALLLPNFSVVLLQALGSPMQWFSHEWLSMALFGPMALAGMFGIQYLFHDKKASNGANELNTLSGLQMFFTFALAAASYVGLASSYVFALFTICVTTALAFNHRKAAINLKDNREVSHVDLATYFIASLLPTAYFSFVCFSLLDMFIPLTGRIGVDAPVDHIVAVMSGFITFVFCPPLLAFSHRFGRAVLKRIILGLVVAHLIMVLISSAVMHPYDELHPKRVFVQHLRNMTSGESVLYLAHADPGPFYESYVTEVESMFKTDAKFRSGSANPSDWNAIYPFNQFLESYVLDTTPYIRSQTTNKTISESTAPLTGLIQGAPKLIAENVSYDPKTGLRRLTVLCTHPNYIWTVATFDTHLASWSLGSSDPFPYATQYVIRHVGGYVSDGWRVDLEYYAAGPEDKLRIDLTAMETEGFGRDTERELEGSGEIGVMKRIVKSRPLWTTLTYFSILTDTFEL
ncbi:hypothetical protein BGZ50_005791 [Haplosporangium sp. Z 11]|nr:hypothetical protein BGZ50_005791 [Haplosporangium sp. Z 11]